MPQIINTNIASLNAQRNLNKSQAANETALQRLSSGLRINSAKDDAAGLAISTRFDAQIKGTSVAIRNAGDGVSLAQTAEGALNSITTSLQRIRELALQSSNDTNTDLDRSALNAEVEQLVAEIKTTSENASFNGKKLLDGSFSKATFQTGANVGQNISFGIAKTTVDTLGTGASNGISSDQAALNGTTLNAGDLVINGVAVGASNASDDTSSTSLAVTSAIAKAAAINKVSDLTGVTAKANANFVGNGTATTVATSGTGATIILNGVSINIQTGSTTASVNANAIADAINSVSGQTGVRAELSDTTSVGINLISDDGRNIAVSGNVGNAGIAAAGVYTGTYTLSSESGKDISISTTTSSLQANAGFQEGTYRTVNSGAVSGTATTALASGDLVINGVAVGATTSQMDNASVTLASGSAIAKASAINAVSAQSGVTAEVAATRVYSGAVTAAASTFTLNGVSLNIAAESTIGDQVSSIIDAVNAKTGQTGVRATVLDGDQFTLVADDGRNILIGGASAGNGLTAGTTAASIVLKSGGPIELSSTTGAINTNSGFEVGTYGGTSSGQLLKDIDISTVAGAEKAIKAVDNALKSVSTQAANLGAIQSRFASTISNLAVTSENLSAANSRIKDADFAAETAELSRTQVLQQAGISILAQANARPQQALSLLQ